MANQQTIVWTALPNGLTSDGRGRLSVFVAPRLLSDEIAPVLADFPDFVDWPARVRGLGFAASVDGIPAPIAAQPTFAPRSDLWAALFKPTTPVRSFGFIDRSRHRFISYQVGEVLDHVLDQYIRLGLDSPDDLPPYDRLVDPERGLRTPSLLALAEGLGRAELLERAAGAPPATSTDGRLIELLLFHRPRFTEPAPLTPPSLDFHDAIAALAEFPILLRLLGLVVDLELESAGALPGPGRVRVVTDWTSSTLTTISTPFTHWEAPFAARPRPVDPELVDGLLRLGEPRFQAVQVDVDGAAIKLVELADTLHRYATDPERGSPPSTGLPALRTAGIAVARAGRAGALKATLDLASLRNDVLTQQGGPGAIELHAEDLTRGYRLWVNDGRGLWFSVCRRHETHRFLDADPSSGVVSTEWDGWVSTGVTESNAATPDLHLHEVLFRWEGWALCAPRPGAALSPNSETPTRDPTTPPPAFRLETRLRAVPGSLPRLRFGRAYKLAASQADLAGNERLSVRMSDPDVMIETTYQRYEPAAPPTVVLTERLNARPGEALERLVIRSDNRGERGDETPTAEVSERHLAAPPASQLLADTHGMFDPQDPQESYALITSREGAFPMAGGGSTDPLVPVSALDPRGALRLPYLPDPIADGVTLCELPGLARGDLGSAPDDGPLVVVRPAPPEQPPVSTVVVEIEDRDAWQDARSLRVRLADGARAPVWDPATRVLTATLPKGTTRTVRCSSTVRKRLDELGLFRLLLGAAGPAARERFLRAATQGRHWMLTPNREITLVHATRQPVGRPRCSDITPARAPGQTSALLDGLVVIDGPSTGEIELRATCEEWLDVGDTPERPTLRDVHVATLKIPPPPINDEGPRELAVNLAAPPGGGDRARHELGDTRYRRALYRAIGTTRFAECFPAGTGELTRESEPFGVDIPASAPPASLRIHSVVPTFAWSRETAGGVITSVRRGDSFRVYLHRSWYSSGGGELLGVVLLPPPFPRSEAEAKLFAPYVTRFGGDAVLFSWPPTLSRTNHFPLAAVRAEGVGLAALPGTTVDVAAHEVHFDPERRLWYADIRIREAEVDYYAPFVRAALARYQSNALSSGGVDLRLGPVDLAEDLQLLPDRTVTIAPKPTEPGRLRVQVNGQVYMGRADERGQSQYGGSVVEVVVQRRRADLEDEVLGWEDAEGAVIEPDPVPPQTTLLPDPGPLLWHGDVVPPAGGARLRLVVREYEEITADGGPGGPTVTQARRLVYADAILLD